MRADQNYERLVEEYFGELPPVNRVKDWDEFSKYMHDYIEKYTVSKYQGDDKYDLIAIMEPMDCIWTILRYALRMFRRKGKKYDIQKIAHYAQIAWSKSKESGSLKSIGIELDTEKTA
jgi:hypothetical protein